MMRGFSLRQTFILILLAVLFGSSSLVSLGNADNPLDPFILKLRYFLVGTSSLLLLLMSRFDMGRFHSKAVPFLLVWTLFNLVSVISGLTNNDLISLRDGLWLIIGAPLIFFSALPKLMKKRANLLIVLALFLGHVPYIVASLALYPLNTSLYKGVFANSNELGSTAAAMAAGIFSLLIAALSAKRSVFYVSLIILLLLVIFAIILVSNSRTSLLAFFAMFSILVWKSGSNLKVLVKIAGIITAIITVILLFAGEKPQLIWKNIELGFSTKVENNGTFDGREEIWKKTFDDMNLFGHGSDYFELNFGIGGHNTIIDALGRNGIIAAYLLLGFAIVSFFYAYFYFKTYAKEDHYAIVPLVITACFWILAMGESMFGSLGSGITLAYMLSMGVVVTRPLSTIRSLY